MEIEIEQKILEKALAMFKTYGVKSIAMDDIAKELGISKKTLYQYITNKEDLINKTVTQEMINNEKTISEVLDLKLNVIEETFLINDRICNINRDTNPSTVFDLKKYYPTIYNRIHEHKRKQMYESIIDNIRRGKQGGLYRMELDEEIISRLYVNRVETIFDEIVFTKNELMSSNVMLEILIYHIRGIANENGIAKLNEVLIKKNNKK